MIQVIDSIPWVRCASGNVFRRRHCLLNFDYLLQAWTVETLLTSEARDKQQHFCVLHHDVYIFFSVVARFVLLANVMVLACVLVLASVVMLVCVLELVFLSVLAPVLVLRMKMMKNVRCYESRWFSVEGIKPKVQAQKA